MSGHTVLVTRPSPESINTGLTSCNPSTLRAKFGEPRGWYDQQCRPVTGHRLKPHILRGTWFGQPLYGLKPAVESLARIELKIRDRHPDLVQHIGHAGMLCCRYQRGSTVRVSNHAWGNAIDLTYDGEVDRRGDDKCQAWLLLVYKFFRDEGWYWGSEFRTEDSMHFELADETVRRLGV